MKKSIITVCVLATMTFASSALCLDFQSDKGTFLSLTNLEAISASETICFTTSGTKTGVCKKSVNNTGDVCVESGILEKNDCTGHGSK